MNFTEGWDQAKTLILELKHRGTPVYLFGSLGVWGAAARMRPWLVKARRGPKDIDVVTEVARRGELKARLEELGYALDQRIAVATEGQLYVFSKGGALDVEAHFGELNFCHRIRLGGRLQGDLETLAFTDLFLSKLQIENPTPADACDLIALLGQLLSSREAGGSGAAVLDRQRMAEVVGVDWGFWYTATKNLRQTEEWIRQFGCGLDASSANSVTRAAASVLTIMAELPKSMRWRLRGYIGTRMQWYQDVSEDRRAF